MEFNIVYFAFVGQNYGGVEQKVIAQFDALSALKEEVHLYLVFTANPNNLLAKEISKRKNITILINSPKQRRNPFSRRREKFQMMEEVIRNFDKQKTIIYMRYPLADFIFLSFLKKVCQYKIVTEHQEIENTFTKGKLNGNYLRNTFEFLWGKKVRNLVSGFVGVTPEITEYQLSVANKPGRFALTNGNGINISNYLLRHPSYNHPEVIKILFVGAGYRTHGLQRLLNSISNYLEKEIEDKFKINLRVAGDSKEMNYNRKLSSKLVLEDSVDFLGHCEGELLNELYNWADVAVGSLGLHRIGLNQSSTLKAREYFCRGIPFFWSSIDVDLPENNPFVLKLDANEDPFDLKKVIDFILENRKSKSVPSEMRKYAEDHLDWKHKMMHLNSFFDQIMSSSGLS